MPVVHCYLPEELAERLRRRARAARLPISRYLCQLIEKDLEGHWPDGYFELFGTWQGEPLERPPQDEFERRTSSR